MDVTADKVRRLAEARIGLDAALLDAMAEAVGSEVEASDSEWCARRFFRAFGVEFFAMAVRR